MLILGQNAAMRGRTETGLRSFLFGNAPPVKRTKSSHHWRRDGLSGLVFGEVAIFPGSAQRRAVREDEWLFVS